MSPLLRSVLMSLWLCVGVACSVYDDELTYSNPIADSGGSSPARDACVSDTEVCNGVDDDCDGEVDEAQAVQQDCSSRILNRPSICAEKVCVQTGDCYDGYFNCDGLPENGCEATCPCGEDCQDSEDAGRDLG